VTRWWIWCGLVGIIADFDELGVQDLKVGNGFFDDGAGVVGGASLEDFGANGDEEGDLESGGAGEGAVE